MHQSIKIGLAGLKDALVNTGRATAAKLPRGPVFAIMPILSTALLFPALLLLVGPGKAVEGVRLAALGVLSDGRLVVLEAGQQNLLEPFVLAAGVLYLDLCFALALVYNFQIFHQMPFAGETLKRLESRSRAMLHKSIARKALTYAGLTLIVALPLGGTGAVGGAFFGRLLGLSRSRTLSGIAAGSLVGNAALAAGAHFRPHHLRVILEHPLFGAVGAAVAICVALALLSRIKKIHA